jgi:hypothetical protein
MSLLRHRGRTKEVRALTANRTDKAEVEAGLVRIEKAASERDEIEQRR